jgi:acyl-CoA reductase-like NAD-dependent aldehyde dehydrogenase
MNATSPRLEADVNDTLLPRFGSRVCSLVSGMCGSMQPEVENAQGRWAMTSVQERLRVLREARRAMAADAANFAGAISPRLARTKADTLVTELLPLLDACKFLEREAKRLLAPRRLGGVGRPWWMGGGVAVEIYREPIGHVLILGPANFPLFLPGVQALQALAAGNAVTWKPGAGGAAVAELVLNHLRAAGLAEGLLTVTDESVGSAQVALADGAGKVVFTGSSENGRKVLAMLAKSGTPAVVEMSGADAVFVTPTADLQQVAKAVAFGLRLNGGAVCMSPRRLFASRTSMTALRPLLEMELAKVPPVALDAQTAAKLKGLLAGAVAGGAVVQGEFRPNAQRPLLVSRANARMEIACSDIFAPVLSLLECESMLHAMDQYALCPYALTVSIFCGRSEDKKARTMGKMLKAGTVLVNDLIAPTADPRVPFGGRGASGYGVTRGAEGLLEMTQVKTLIVRRGGRMRHLDPTSEDDVQTFSSLIEVAHGKGLGARWSALIQLMTSSRR